MTRTRKAVAALCAVQVIDVMGVTVVVTALPQMLRTVGGSPAQAGLVVPVYAVGFAGLLLVSARLGDRYGHRRLLLSGLVIFAVGSVLAAAAPGIAVLVAARGVQGVAAAISVPNALVILTGMSDTDSGRERALGAWNACGGLAGALGLVAGGVVTTVLSWRTIFWANLVIALTLVVAILRLIPDRATSSETRAPLPLVSAALQATAIGALVAAANIAERSPAASLPIVGVAVLAVVALGWWERRAPRPLIAPSLWRRPGFLAGLAGSFGVTATTSSFVSLATLYLQNDRGLSAASAGLLILPFSIAVIVAAAGTGRLIGRWGAARMVVGGLTLIVISIGAASLWPNAVTVIVAIAVNGLGNGTAAAAAYALATAVPAEHHGTAAGLLNTAAQTGTAVLVALSFAVASYAGNNTLDQRAGWATAAAAGLVIIAIVAATTRGGHRWAASGSPAEPSSTGTHTAEPHGGGEEG